MCRIVAVESKGNRKKVVFYALKSAAPGGVVDSFALANTLAAHYLTRFAAKDERINGAFEFAIREFRSLDELLADAEAERPAMACFTCYLENVARQLDAANRLKERLPETVVAVGGPAAADSDRIVRDSTGVDVAARGEGEEIFAALLREMVDGRSDFSRVDGVSFRDGGRITTTPNAEPIADIAEIPSVYTEELAPELSNIVIYETSRGCRFKCRFCTWTWHHRRFHTLERIDRELSLILSLPAVKRVYIVDSEFGEEPERAKEILKIIEKRNAVGAGISCFMSFRNVDEELLQLCARLGQPAEVPFGLQSVNREVLDAVGRKWFRLEDFEAKLPMIFKYIPPERFVIDLVYGLPFDDHAGLRRSAEWALERGFPRLNFFRLGVNPGSEFHDTPEKYGLEFDPAPPYLVRRSNTYSAADIARSERFIVSLLAMLSFLDADDYRRLKSLGFDILDAAENIHRAAPEWDKCYQRIGESNVANVKPEAARILCGRILDSKMPQKNKKSAVEIVTGKFR